MTDPAQYQLLDATGAPQSFTPPTDYAKEAKQDAGNASLVDIKAQLQTGVTPVSAPASVVASASFNRPNNATAYAAGDLVANNTNNGSVSPMVLALARINDGTFNVRRLRLKVNDSAWKGSTVRIHLFRDQPTVSVGDNGVLNTSETYGFSESNYLDSVDIALSKQTSDGYVKGFGLFDFVTNAGAGSQTLFALLETRSAVTPAASKTFTLEVEALRD